jgi:dTDP-4-amino-4,6-dideoxygalactose transaminase
LRQLRNYGQTRKYYHESSGYNSRLDELQAAILRVKLHHLDDWNAARRLHAGRYSRLLGGSQLVCPHHAAWGDPVFHIYAIRSSDRDRLQEHVKKQGVGTLIHYPIPVHRQRLYANTESSRERLPVTENTAMQILSLPMYAELSEDQITHVCQVILEFAH